MKLDLLMILALGIIAQGISSGIIFLTISIGINKYYHAGETATIFSLISSISMRKAITFQNIFG
ncbi:MAG: hypothetical protein LBM95_07985 [Lactobacillales bacterium]|jgi:hypothetical protein|nr:hypothetical protein [Lactobacillales bacterium]